MYVYCTYALCEELIKLPTPVNSTHSDGAMADAQDLLMPAEWSAHECTWMALGGTKAGWGSKALPRMQENIIRLAIAISRFEPVNLLVRDSELAWARGMLSVGSHGGRVTLLPASLDDIWMRDTCAVFAVSRSLNTQVAINLNFNGWGCKMKHKRDAKVAAFVATASRRSAVTAGLVLEAGGVEVDGEGTALLTESCILNRNRNPLLTKEACEAEMLRLFGISKCIWFDGVRGEDITDGHIDGYCRFVRPCVVIAHFDADERSPEHAITKDIILRLQQSTDSKGNKLQVVVIPGPQSVRSRNSQFCASYVNIYMCNGALFCPSFGCEISDKFAQTTFQKLCPEREIVMIDVDAICEGGGGIHCCTMQQPRQE